MLDHEFLRLLQCTRCKRSGLRPRAIGDEIAGLRCAGCGHEFAVRAGVPDMMTGMAHDGSWAQKLALLDAWWRNERGRPVVLPQRPWRPPLEVAGAYLDMAGARGGTGRVLDMGCGDGRRHAHFAGKRYWGVDPLPRRDLYPFPFARAVGENLPFAGARFDAVLSIEVLDHVIDPDQYLAEARRVIAPGGSLFLFVGVGRMNETGAAYQATYVTAESDVHTHVLAPEWIEATLSPVFSQFRVVHTEHYLACWGQGRLVRSSQSLVA